MLMVDGTLDIYGKLKVDIFLKNWLPKLWHLIEFEIFQQGRRRGL